MAEITKEEWQIISDSLNASTRDVGRQISELGSASIESALTLLTKVHLLNTKIQNILREGN